MSVISTPVTEIFKADFASHQSPLAEFPVTTMSSDLTSAIGLLPLAVGYVPRLGLDVGTGSGLHAAAMAVAGVDAVFAIDISRTAVSAATKRFARVKAMLDAAAGRPVTMPRFAARDMMRLTDDEKFDLVVANPPSFFRAGNDESRPLGEPPDAPMVSALFDGEREDAGMVERSFLYQLFGSVVPKILGEEGIVLCSWPAIQSRIADGPDGRLVHPLDRLERWFGWTFDNGERNPEKFFNKVVRVASYGRDDGLMNQVAADVASGGMYSTSMSVSENLTLTFRYGILCLRLKPRLGLHFRTLDL